MRLHDKVDANHAEIVSALRRCAVAVKSLAAIGGGMPDLLVCFRGQTSLMEIKSPGQKLNAAQEEFIASWPGAVFVVDSAEMAVRVVVEAARPDATKHGSAAGAESRRVE